MEKERIGSITAACMVALAVIFDVLQAGATFILNIIIPGSGFIAAIAVSMVAFIIFFVWFLLCGVVFLSGKNPLGKFLSLLGFAVVEFIPLMNAIPGLSGWVITTIVQIKLEDKGYAADRATAIRTRFVESKRREQRAAADASRAA